MEQERELSGGNATDGVVRVGGTVRKPWADNTEKVHDYLRALRARGLDVPKTHGQDAQGRQVIEFVDGALAQDQMPLTHDELYRVGEIVRSIHDASPSVQRADLGSWPVLLPTDGTADLVCHNDLAPWNLIIGARWVFIDWDGAGPSTRLWDLAYSAQAFALLVHGQSVVDATARLRSFINGYDADDELRQTLPDAMARRTGAMSEFLRVAHENGRQPWGRMYIDGHGAHWRETHHYIRAHHDAWITALTSTRKTPKKSG